MEPKYLPKYILQSSNLRVNGDFNLDLYNRRCCQDQVLNKFKNKEVLNIEEANHLHQTYGIMDVYYQFHSLQESQVVIQEEDVKLLRHHPQYPKSIGCHDCIYDNSEIACSPCHFRHYDSGTLCIPVYCQTRIKERVTGVSPCSCFYMRGDFGCWACMFGLNNNYYSDEMCCLCVYNIGDTIISPCFCHHSSTKETFVPVVPNGLERKYHKKAMKYSVATQRVKTETNYIYGFIPCWSTDLERGPVIQTMSNKELIEQVG
jgi:hypothetical protein